MIDVVHPDASQVASAAQHHHTDAAEHREHSSATAEQGAEDAEEAAWLESIGAADLAVVRDTRPGNLVMDVRLLRGRTESIY